VVRSDMVGGFSSPVGCPVFQDALSSYCQARGFSLGQLIDPAGRKILWNGAGFLAEPLSDRGILRRITLTDVIRLRTALNLDKMEFAVLVEAWACEMLQFGSVWLT